MNNNIEKTNEIAFFDDSQVRKEIYKGKWHFVIEDIIKILVESEDPKQYIQKMRARDEILSQGWVQIVHTLKIKTKGGRQDMLCADLEGIFRIIQSITSPKAEPLKL